MQPIIFASSQLALASTNTFLFSVPGFIQTESNFHPFFLQLWRFSSNRLAPASPTPGNQTLQSRFATGWKNVKPDIFHSTLLYLIQNQMSLTKKIEGFKSA